MQIYKEMYYNLFNKITDVIRELQEIQQNTEELFIDYEDKIVFHQIKIK